MNQQEQTRIQVLNSVLEYQLPIAQAAEIMGLRNPPRRSIITPPFTILSQRRAVRDDLEAIMAGTLDMTEFLKESELHERRAFVETFVKEIVVMPGKAVIRYTVPMPDDSHMPGADSEEILLGGSVTSAGVGGHSFMESPIGGMDND